MISDIEVEARAYVEAYGDCYTSGTRGAFDYLKAMLKVIDELRAETTHIGEDALTLCELNIELNKLRAPPRTRPGGQMSDEQREAEIRGRDGLDDVSFLLQRLDAKERELEQWMQIVSEAHKLIREARAAAIEEAARAAKGNDAERITTHDAAAAYLVGRLDAASDVRALKP